ncbi:MAG TPA: glutamine--fructose-6-phosphate transaminase (isomerizing), partial [Mizugakiibacter sp.]|nr:glutamine--fructose-6-phosphate transaminase (isomerizing) [Mizugakiibacter sp.]
MCGIVAAVAQRDVAQILIEGLKALEYRGYDSAGLAVIQAQTFHRLRVLGKVRELEARHAQAPFAGGTGIAHTRWATHGVPSEANAHPHRSGRVLLVHNGIIENHADLRDGLLTRGHQFSSETDSEIIAHLIDEQLSQGQSLLQAVRHTLGKLDGAYALAVADAEDPEQIIGARRGSPLVLGIGIGEHFLASDMQALIKVTNQVIYLENGDLVEIRRDRYSIHDGEGRQVIRTIHESDLSSDTIERGKYRHYMQKEIFEQPRAVAATLEGRLGSSGVLAGIFGPESQPLLDKVRGVHIVACGTSYHAGLIARVWIEKLAGLPVNVEVASEYRYRDVVVPDHTLLVALSQSGETADTLAALRESSPRGYLGTLAICNVPESSLVRESMLKLMTRAGPEIGVASTKAFTTQIAALALLTLELARTRGLDGTEQAKLAKQLAHLPQALQNALQTEAEVEQLAAKIMHRQHALFLGRGAHFAVALEGALKLKEISYIHAEAYPAGELKHGPLALVDENMPVIAVAPNNAMFDKLKSNLEEVRARGGKLYVFADRQVTLDHNAHEHIVRLDAGGVLIAPAVFTIPL